MATSIWELLLVSGPKAAGITAMEIDMILVATVTPDKPFPSSASNSR